MALLAGVLVQLWRLEGPPWTVTESFWLLHRRGLVVSVLWLSGIAAIVSLSAAWVGGVGLRRRLAITWLVTVVVVAGAFPGEAMAIAKAVWQRGG